MPQARSLRFPKKRRLVRTSEFDQVRRHGSFWRGKFLLLSIWKSDNEGPFRAGFITARQLGNAVTRNRIRRRLREVVWRHQHEMRGKFWMVIIARTAARDASYQALEDEWLRLAKRASILTP